jgi:hypothetical protein
MSMGARILAMCNRYDRLCAPESPDVPPLMPSEALAYMLRQESSKYDTQMLAALIKLLGVYPPGTVIKLSDGKLALVVSPGADIQRPRVLLYRPDSGDADAPLLDLAKAPDLKVTEAIRPASWPRKCCNGSTHKNVWPVSFRLTMPEPGATRYKCS